jgi:Predicted nucleic acid-binding protein, contains PIN domain
MFVDLAYSAKIDYIITLDEKSGLLKLKNSSFNVCTPEQYLEIVKENKAMILDILMAPTKNHIK